VLEVGSGPSAKTAHLLDFNSFRHGQSILKFDAKMGLVGGQGFAVDASSISADFQKQNSSNPEDRASRVTDTNDAPSSFWASSDCAAHAASKTSSPLPQLSKLTIETYTEMVFRKRKRCFRPTLTA
jgi:hypothetical protein